MPARPGRPGAGRDFRPTASVAVSQRTVGIRCEARDENDPRALFEDCKRAVEKRTNQKLPGSAEPPADEPPKVADERLETVAR